MEVEYWRGAAYSVGSENNYGSGGHGCCRELWAWEGRRTITLLARVGDQNPITEADGPAASMININIITAHGYL